MTPPLTDLYRLLRQQAEKWVREPEGVAYDSGHCDSEISAGEISRWLEAAPAGATVDSELERLALAWNLPGAAGGSYQDRQWAAERGPKWGFLDLHQALERQGFAEAWKQAKTRVWGREVDFVRTQARQPAASAREALGRDVEAWLQAEGAQLPAEVREQAADVIASTQTQGFWGAARAMRAFALAHPECRPRGIGALEQVLKSFGNFDSPLFGLVPDPDWNHAQRRYRALGAGLDSSTGLNPATLDKPAARLRLG